MMRPKKPRKVLDPFTLPKIVIELKDKYINSFGWKIMSQARRTNGMTDKDLLETKIYMRTLTDALT